MAEETNEQVLQELNPAKQEEQEIGQLLASLGTTGDWQAKLTRLEPKDAYIKGKKRSVHGSLRTYTSPFTEEDIFEEFGGGKYQIRVLRSDKKDGKLKWSGGKTFNIAGDPKLPSDKLNDYDDDTKVIATPVSSKEDSDLSAKALDIMDRNARYERERADKERERAAESKNNNGHNMELMQLMLKPMYDQIAQAQRENSDLRRQLIDSQEKMTETLSKKPDTSFQDAILGRMIDTKSSEINAIRTQHESELRTIREANRDEIKRLEDRHTRDLDNIRSDYKRQQETIKDSYEHRIKTLELSHQQSIAIHEMTIKRLEHDLSATRNEVVSLRSEKIKSPTDMIGELARVKESLELLSGGGDGEEDERPAWERVIDKISGSPVVARVAERFANPQPSVPQYTQQQLEAMQQAEVEKEDMNRGFSQKDVDLAISFIEQAINSGKDPIEFARAAQNMIPKKFLDQIMNIGADQFVDSISGYRPDSVVASLSGRKFVKAVIEFLSSRE